MKSRGQLLPWIIFLISFRTFAEGPLTEDQCVREALTHGVDGKAADLTWSIDQESFLQTLASTGFALTGTGAGGEQSQTQITSGSRINQWGQNLSGALVLASSETRLGLTATHQIAEDPYGSISPTTDIDLNLSQQLFDGYPGGKPKGQLLQALVQKELRNLARKESLDNLAFRVRVAYISLWGAVKAEETKKAAWEALAQNEKATRAFLVAKTVTQLDVLQAENMGEAARLDWQAAIHDHGTARGRLARLMGYPWETPLEIVEPAPQSGPVPHPAEAQALALKNRVEMARWTLGQRGASLDLALRKADSYPTVSLTGDMSYSKVWGSAQTEYWGFTGGLSVAFSIWDGGSAQSRERSSLSSAELLDAQKIEVEDSLFEDVDTALFTLQDSLARVSLAKGSLDQAGLALVSAETKFNSGLAARLDVLNALSAREVARYQLVQAKTNQELAWLNLERGEGWPE